MENNNEKKEIKTILNPNAFVITLMKIGFDEELFHFLIISGNQAHQFLASPKHAKRIYLLLKQCLEQYEKKFGELKTQLPEKKGTTEKEEKMGF